MGRIDSSVGAYAICMLLSCVLLGCTDSSQNLVGMVRNSMGRMSLKSAQEAENAERLCDETARLLCQGPSVEAREVIRQLGVCYKRIEFDERTFLKIPLVVKSALCYNMRRSRHQEAFA